MFTFLKGTFLLLALFIVSTLFATKARAAEDFSTDYVVTYNVQSDGNVHVTQAITLTNLESGTYAKEFNLSVSSLTLVDIKAYNQSGPLEAQVTQDGDKTNIHIPFTEKIIGKGKSHSWTLEYNTKDIASVEGKVLTVTIPRVSTTSGLGTYTVLLKVPQTFGQPATVVPSQLETRREGKNQVFVFEKELVAKQGVHAIFGQSQFYNFHLSYKLANPSLLAVQKEVTLLPATPYQNIVIESMSPKPYDVYADKDGNWIAVFSVERNQKLSVEISGKMQLYLSPQYKEALTKEQKGQYVKPQQFWEADNQKVLNILETFTGNSNNQNGLQAKRGLLESDVHDAARKIFDFVAATVEFQKEVPAKRQGALATLDNPKQARAQDFADLFVTLARASGIPARVVVGFDRSTKTNLKPKDAEDALHAWAQYYSDDKGWVSVDPTWSSTTGGVDYFDSWDVNHITAAFWGLHSQDPIPVGVENYTGKNDTATFALTDTFPQLSADAFVSARITSNSGAGFPGKGEVYVENRGKIAVTKKTIELSSDGFDFLSDKTFTIDMLPPFATARFPFTFRSRKFFQFTRSSILVKMDNKIYTIPVTVSPFGGRVKQVIFVPIVGGAIIGGLMTVLLRKRRKRKLKEAEDGVQQPKRRVIKRLLQRKSA